MATAAMRVRDSLSVPLGERIRVGLLGDTQAVVFLNEPAAFGAALPLAYAQLRLGVPREALPNIERAIELDPSIGDGYLYRGEVHMMEGRKREACEDLQRAGMGGSDVSRSPLASYCRG